MTVTSTGAYTASYLTTAYGRSTTTSSSSGASTASTSSTSSATTSSATVVTLSAAAQAKLAQSALASIDTVVADTRTALDALYAAAKVTGPLANDKPTVSLASLDRRALYAVTTNAGEKFTADEQTAAGEELQARFDTTLSPQAAVARLTGDWSKVYQAALDFMNAAGTEEQASDTWKAQVAVLQQGLSAATATPGTQPSIADDPVAAFLTRAGDDGQVEGNQRAFSDVAKDVRTALDLQKKAAADQGLDLIYNGLSRRSGTMVDLSTLDNRALSALSLNEGGQFSAEEVRAGKSELDARTRKTLLAAFQQAGSTSDPRAFSLGLIYSYQAMGDEERQAMNWTNDLRDLAVTNYQSTSSLMSMLQQGSDSTTNYFG